jgi:hypothetical protein
LRRLHWAVARIDGRNRLAWRTLLRAALFGIGAGILGAAIYYGVLALTGYNIGLVAIGVGILVGRAVRKGSGGFGGRGYQSWRRVLRISPSLRRSCQWRSAN